VKGVRGKREIIKNAYPKKRSRRVRERKIYIRKERVRRRKEFENDD